ncbi:shikimate dehydrogenase [Maricaulaceae bacterium NA33B04]|nr:shikimate dehydrogenase [Maricaulaceae bacterium NA33B04]
MKDAPFAAVAGFPVNHSLSPVMMRRWLDDAKCPGEYGRVEIAPSYAERFFKALPELGWAGVNVTVPHKEIALQCADHATDAVKAIGAANLLTVTPEGTLKADNTDIIGIEAALAGDKTDTPAVLIGAGGAARAALYYLARQDRQITIVNRTRKRAEALAATCPVSIQISTDLNEALMGAGLVINATSLGMSGQPALVPDLSTTESDALIFDMVYAPLETGLLKQGARSGRRCVDGLEMLIGQARPSFEAFFGVRPPADTPIKSTLLKALGQQA